MSFVIPAMLTFWLMDVRWNLLRRKEIGTINVLEHSFIYFAYVTIDRFICINLSMIPILSFTLVFFSCIDCRLQRIVRILIKTLIF